ncbi:hypothetical protein PVK06_001399 [Gossypium arboreum]|uniref:Lon N-terminal domain-containing protein n=1 Tax=Gossypium arboreum TaxID=29729 RepID=A0ABR0R245_GOSAR|nr:hypothetical protein PVK06_001399 [Gossypium arboreum]
MALPRLIPSHSSSSSLTHQPSISLNAVGPYLLNPNFKPFSNSSSLFQSPRFHRLGSLRCFASSFPEKRHPYPPQSDESVQISLFPLPLVLFPGAVLPLQIFEFRYRIMMHTLLHTDLPFGVIYSDPVGGTFDVGFVGEIFKHERLVDDRFFLILKAKNGSASPTSYVGNHILSRKSTGSKTPSSDEDLEGIADEVESCTKDVIRLSNRLNGKPLKEAQDLRRNLFPTPFSFFVGSTFKGAPNCLQHRL